MKIINKQNRSSNCFICGIHNEFGLHMEFYETDTNELISLFTTKNEHQSYPNRTHGGVITAILDETIGRAILIHEKDTWGVTTEINIKFKRPVPLNTELKVIGRITKNSRLIFTGTGEIVDDEGNIYATAIGKYLKGPLENITGIDMQGQWLNNDFSSDELRCIKDKLNK